MCPFDLVIISFPDINAARAATTELAQLEQDLSCPIYATTDPRGMRVGSGGALLDVVRTYHCSDHDRPERSSILLVLAGGESSRCPTQMILGKAWTSLPSLAGPGKAALTTPLQVGLKMLSRLTGLPRGSIVVIAGDTLLRLAQTDEESFHLEATNDFDVIGLAVPAPCETAQNHGVYVFDDSPDFESTQLLATTHVWQKPSLSQLHKVYSNWAWIDTGVVLLLPSVVQALRHLSSIYYSDDTAPDKENQQTPSLSGVKLDLYTHFLQALRTCASGHSKNSYCDSFPLHEQPLVSIVWDVLSPFSLGIWCRPGDFLHLGSSRELVDFVQVATLDANFAENLASLPCSCPNDATHTVRTRVGRSLPLIPRLHTVTQGVCVAPSVVATYTLIVDPTGQSKIGPRTVLEHCHLQLQQHRIDVGSDCLISGLRPIPGIELSWAVPNGMLVHMIPWNVPVKVDEGINQLGLRHVLIVVGLDDDIKSLDTVFGRSWPDLLEWTGLCEADIWEESSAVRNLWTAKLHGILHPQSTGTILDWLSDYVADSNRTPSHDVLQRIQMWKASPRVSLLDIRDGANAGVMEFGYRRDLVQTIQRHQDAFFHNIRRMLLAEHFETLDWRWIIQEFQSSHDTANVCNFLHTLDAVVVSSLSHDKDDDEDVRYDICGRACRLSSSFLRDLIEQGSAGDNTSTLLEGFDLPMDTMNGMQQSDHSLTLFFQRFASWRDGCMRQDHIQTFQESSKFMDAMAQTMTSRCVFGGIPRSLAPASSHPPVIGRWVIATAPARIDFAGGWTDTPPICFEYGSCVTGVAVTVDDLRPLSARCRIVPGSGGILLRAEDRDGRTGALRFPPVEAKIHRSSDLADYGIPTADCALLKCALVLLGLLPLSPDARDPTESDFQAQLGAFCRTEEPVGMEVVATSLLPHGSGLGTSSILGGCVLACLARCLGRDDMVGDPRSVGNGLLDAVLKLEQLLTTGGGFQDQVNGLVGGAKTVSCDRLSLPLKLTIEPLPLGEPFRADLNENMVLVFTGKTRLAKNLLQNVLSRWSRQTAEIRDTVAGLADGARKAKESILRGNLDELGAYLSSYWEHKKVMAGAESGVEPAPVAQLLRALRDRRAIRGASLCGAGGGGFLILLLAVGFDQESVRPIVDDALGRSATEDFTWQRCAVSEEGLLLHVLEADAADASAFDLSWHQNKFSV